MYFITTITKDFNEFRCIGYFKDLSNAKRILEYNVHDVYECGYYPYAVIEFIPEGIYRYDLEPQWYKWDKIDNKYIECIFQPLEIKNCVGFAIG